MANESNGHSSDGLESPPLPSGEYAIFRIGGRDLRIGALSLWDLEQLKEEFAAIGATDNLITQAMHVVRIVAYKTAPSPEAIDAVAESLSKSCSYKEYQNLAAAFNSLLEVSGWEFPPTDQGVEAQAENPGTGTSTELPAN